jgi:putative CocE/NonD family hydrolase
MPRPRVALAALVCLLAPALALAQAPPQPPAPKSVHGPHDVDLTWGVKVPLRDGVKLNATLYRPRGLKAPRPAVVTITPYIADTYHERGMYFASHGYAFAAVDVRGRGNSEGDFEPFANEGRDGHDVVEWLARQSWCNGKVGMWGGSYAGFNQWATAKEFPPHLATIVPAASAYPGVDFPAPGGILHAYWIQWLTYVSGTTGNHKLFGDDAFWIRKFHDAYVGHVPFRELDVLAGNPSRHFRKWLEHRTPDAYWDAMVPAPEQYAKLDLPILTITGQYDGDQPGALEYYQRHARHGPAKAFAQHYLLLGPWDHLGTRTPTQSVGGLTFSPISMVDMNLLHKDWYDWTLKGASRPPVLRSPILYYVTGKERWKHADSLEAIGARPRRFYLSAPDGRANDVFHSGLLTGMAPGKEPPTAYVYDPLDVRPAELEKDKITHGLTDQRFALHLFGAGLVFHSAPLERPTEITGRIKLTAWVEMDVPDTDFVARVYEVRRDGSTVLLGDDQLRARFRESPSREKLARPGEVNCYELKGFLFTARQLAKGSRLRLVFGAASSIFLEKNYHSGLPLGTESKKDARTAHVRLHHDAAHPSFLELPEVPAPPRPGPVLPKDPSE